MAIGTARSLDRLFERTAWHASCVKKRALLTPFYFPVSTLKKTSTSAAAVASTVTPAKTALLFPTPGTLDVSPGNAEVSLSPALSSVSKVPEVLKFF